MSEPESSHGCTIEDTASQLGIKPDEVHGLIAAGALQATGSGDALRVTPESMLTYQKRHIAAPSSDSTRGRV